MQSLSIYARLFGRVLSGTEGENIILNSLLRLSSSSAYITRSSNRLAITYPSSRIRHALHLVTASSGYSSYDINENQCIKTKLRTNHSIEQQTNPINVFGDDAFFVTKHCLGDFLGILQEINNFILLIL